jgi:hypothetical protein
LTQKSLPGHRSTPGPGRLCTTRSGNYFEAEAEAAAAEAEAEAFLAFLCALAGLAEASPEAMAETEAIDAAEALAEPEAAAEAEGAAMWPAAKAEVANSEAMRTAISFFMVISFKRVQGTTVFWVNMSN